MSKLERCDITGAFTNALDINFYHFYQFKKITEKVKDEYHKKINSFSIDAHLELIRFIISQPNLNPTEYYTDVADYALKREDMPEHIYELLLLRLAATNFAFR